jgi:PEGA domain
MNKCLGPLLLCTAVLVSSCSQRYVAQKVTPSAYRPVPSVPYQPPQNKKVEIISEPSGARIEVNNNYVGDAPITVTLQEYGDEFTRNTVIRALPTEAGDYVQTKFFYAGTFGTNDRIPSRIFFDMHLGPATPAVDVNVVPSN